MQYANLPYCDSPNSLVVEIQVPFELALVVVQECFPEVRASDVADWQEEV